MLAAELRELLGELRGREPPIPPVLYRLRDLNCRYRLTWTPEVADQWHGAARLYAGRPALWWVHEVRPGNPHDALRRAAGLARWQRFQHRPQWFQDLHPTTRWECEDQVAGYWTVGSWPEEGVPGAGTFGSDRFFEELREGERSIARLRRSLDLERAYNDAADGEVADELTEDPAFRAQFVDLCRQAAIEDWSQIFSNKLSRVVQGLRPDPPVTEDVAHAESHG